MRFEQISPSVRFSYSEHTLASLGPKMYVGTGMNLLPFLKAINSSLFSPKKSPTHNNISKGPDFLLIDSTRAKNCLNRPLTSPQTRLKSKFSYFLSVAVSEWKCLTFSAFDPF